MRLLKKKTRPPEASIDDIRVADLLEHHGIKTILDIGANKGQYAQRMRMAGFTGTIISFEPLSHNQEILQNLSAADDNWIIAPPMALGNETGEATIHVSQNDDMSSILTLEKTALKALPKSRIVKEETVTVNTLDDIFDAYVTDKKHTPVFVKVDTQGFELPVLQGAQELMREAKITGWQLELSLTPLYHEEPTFETITAWLKEHGYETHFIMQGYFSKKLHRQLQIDGIFFHV